MISIQLCRTVVDTSGFSGEGDRAAVMSITHYTWSQAPSQNEGNVDVSASNWTLLIVRDDIKDSIRRTCWVVIISYDYHKVNGWGYRQASR